MTWPASVAELGFVRPLETMSPNFTFWLDAEGYAQCTDLLAAAGMQFSEQPSVPQRIASLPAEASVRGVLVSPRGTFRAKMSAYEGRYRFVVTVLSDAEVVIGVLDDLERAFAGHLLTRRGTAA